MYIYSFLMYGGFFLYTGAVAASQSNASVLYQTKSYKAEMFVRVFFFPTDANAALAWGITSTPPILHACGVIPVSQERTGTDGRIRVLVHLQVKLWA